MDLPFSLSSYFCLLISMFSNLMTSLSPGSSGCVNRAVATAIATNPLISAALRTPVALWGGLAIGLGVAALGVVAGGTLFERLSLEIMEFAEAS